MSTKRYGAQWRLDYNTRRAEVLQARQFAGKAEPPTLHMDKDPVKPPADNVVHVKFGED